LIAKHIAGRDKDLRFIRDAVAQGWVDRRLLEGRLSTMTIEDPIRELITARIANDFRGTP